ncbi:uncharacterized protein LOC120355011 [Nilaparvata lugens]|uniref:uncharacterized protein LOC120355011 n=1 Tax=Nilaparvata lugens TaxID=108931 RepID=UPI00193CC856|nr:uncharacterized protein LOC120355011 [Nilaparvata lugens]
MSSPSYILPDSPPKRMLNYWQRKAAETSAAAAAAAAAAAPAPLDPASPGGEIIIPDSPIHRLAPPTTWALRRVVLTTVSNKQKQAKRRLLFEEAEVSGDEEEEEEQSICSQTKKRAGMEHDSSLAPLIKEVEGAGELDFVQLINNPQPKPWIPLRELKEHTPYPIVGAREQTNIHGRLIILKITNVVGSKSTSEVYLPQRFASCIDTGKIQHFNIKCKNYVLLVTHKSPNWSDIKIVKQ